MHLVENLSTTNAIASVLAIYHYISINLKNFAAPWFLKI